MKKNRKHLLITLCLLVAVCAISIGGTLAWLTDDTKTVTNTFDPTDIEVGLDETNPTDKTDIDIIPGVNITKDPKVNASSDVPYYVFVKVTETNWLDAKEADGTTLKVKYSINTGDNLWQELTGTNIENVTDNDKVYYMELAAGTLPATSVLKDDKVYVSETLTKEDMENKLAPSLAFTAYAMQKAKSATENFTAVEAWNIASKPAN